MALVHLCERAARLTAQNFGFRPGQFGRGLDLPRLRDALLRRARHVLQVRGPAARGLIHLCKRSTSECSSTQIDLRRVLPGCIRYRHPRCSLLETPNGRHSHGRPCHKRAVAPGQPHRQPPASGVHCPLHRLSPWSSDHVGNFGSSCRHSTADMPIRFKSNRAHHCT